MAKKKVKIPLRYLPRRLTVKDKKKQLLMLQRSKKLYKKHKYYTRKQLPSYHSKTSKHIRNAQHLYKVNRILPNKELARATGCSVDALKKIVQKGEGAYYSSGSRPNQTAQSWGLARLASSITGGKSSAVDFNIINCGCNHRKRAFLLAKKSKKIYGFGHSKTKKITV